MTRTLDTIAAEYARHADERCAGPDSCAEHIALACDTRDEEIRRLKLEIETGDLACMRAERDAALGYVHSLVKLLERTGGFMHPADQTLLRRAQAALVDVARVEGRR